MASERLRRLTFEKQKERLPLLDKITFSVGIFGKDAANTFAGIYYMFFLTQVIFLNSVIVGSIFAASRLLFAFSAPLVGIIIDNTRTRIGKYRPWIMISIIIGAVAMMFMFTDISRVQAAKYIFYLSFYVIWEFANLTLDISMWAFLPTVTYNLSDRNRITSIAKITSGLGSGIITAGVPFFLSYFFISEFEPRGYFVLAIIVTVIMITGGFLVYFLNRERVIYESNFIKLKDLFRSLFQNDQLIAYFLSFLLINIAGSFTNNFAIYFFAYDYGDMKYYGLFTVLAGLGQGIAVFTYPALAKRASIRIILIIATLSSIFGYSLMLIVILLFGVKDIWLLCSVAVLMMFSGGWIATASQAMLLDITDYGEYKLGNRTASVIFSANTMMWRIISSIVVMALGVCLSVAGINGVNLESGIIPVISLSGLWIIRIMMFGIPILFIAMGLIIFLSKYILNNKEMTKIQDSLTERHLKAEEKKERKEELKKLIQQLKDAKRAYRKDYWSKKFKSSDKDNSGEIQSFRRIKKVSLNSAKKRMSNKKSEK